MMSPDIDLSSPASRVRRFDARAALKLEPAEVLLFLGQLAKRAVRIDDLAAVNDVDRALEADELVLAREHGGAGSDVGSRRAPLVSAAIFTFVWSENPIRSRFSS